MSQRCVFWSAICRHRPSRLPAALGIHPRWTGGKGASTTPAHSSAPLLDATFPRGHGEQLPCVDCPSVRAPSFSKMKARLTPVKTSGAEDLAGGQEVLPAPRLHPSPGWAAACSRHGTADGYHWCSPGSYDGTYQMTHSPPVLPPPPAATGVVFFSLLLEYSLSCFAPSSFSCCFWGCSHFLTPSSTQGAPVDSSFPPAVNPCGFALPSCEKGD